MRYNPKPHPRRGLSPAPHPVVLFDGVCNLCNAAVAFIIDRDPEGWFRFAPLQSDVGQALLASYPFETGTRDSVILLDEQGCHTRSKAALRIAKELNGLWPLLYGFIVIPRPIRDALYDFVAANRYRWFGKKETCRLPSPDERLRFLPFELPSPSP